MMFKPFDVSGLSFFLTNLNGKPVFRFLLLPQKIPIKFWKLLISLKTAGFRVKANQA